MTCSECQTEFESNNEQHRTCSPACAAERKRRLARERYRKPKPRPIEVELMCKAGTAIVAEGMCRQCGEPIRLPVPDNSRICSWCWVDGYMPAEDRQRLKEASRW